MAVKRREKQERNSEKGQSIVEFALILPLLILLLAAACDGGWVMLNHIRLNGVAETLAHANREADSVQANSKLLGYVEDHYEEIDSSRMTISTTTQVTQEKYYEYVWMEEVTGGVHYRIPMYYEWLDTEVNVSYRLPLLTPFGQMVFQTSGGEITLKAHSDAERILENDSY